MAELFTADVLVALLTLTALEIVLGIDNIVFIAILSGKLPPEKRNGARRLGLLAAMIMRVILLLGISWIMGLTATLFTVGFLGEVAGQISGKDLILFFGGLFLIGKATHEIHGKLEGEDPSERKSPRVVSMGSIIFQIMLMDIIFSLDSVITAVGMVRQQPGQSEWVPLTIMITAVVIAIIVMMGFARPISEFVERHPTVKMLALSFLILIGVMLVADSFNQHIPKGYIYFAMAFSLFVEVLNIRLRRVRRPVTLNEPHMPRA
jgi:predicted tellurium resistance membrane protein TerC